MLDSKHNDLGIVTPELPRQDLRTQVKSAYEDLQYWNQHPETDCKESVNLGDPTQSISNSSLCSPPPLRFLINKKEHHFTVLHGDCLAPIPGQPSPVETAPRRRSVDPELLVGCYWALNAIPYSGFLPTDPYTVCFNDSLFACIFRQKWAIDTEKTPEGDWVLPQCHIDQWTALEDVLLRLRTSLRQINPAHFSLQHLEALSPSHYLYHCPLSNPVILQKRLIRSRYAFLLLGAEILYLYAPLYAQPLLLERFADEIRQTFRDDSLIQDVRQCWIFVPAAGYYRTSPGNAYSKADGYSCVPRWGIFVNVESCTLSRGFWNYECFCVLVWFWWGNCQRTLDARDHFIIRRYGYHTDTVREYLKFESRPFAELEAGKYFEETKYKRGYEQGPMNRPVHIITDASLFAPASQES